jgi:galactokinase
VSAPTTRPGTDPEPTTSTAGRAAPVWYPLPAEPEAARRVADAFEVAYGHPPDGVWAAPGRVNLIGEHVDYNAGLCLPFALPQRTFVALGVRADSRLRLRSVQLADQPLSDQPPSGQPSGGDADGGRAGDAAGTWSGSLDEVGPGLVPGWTGYVAGVPWALARDGFEVPGFDAVIDGQVPFGSGLSSSAALECAVAVALDEVAGLGLAGTDAGRVRLAAACVRAENEVAGAPTGGLDQTASLRCRAGSAALLDCADFSVEQVPFDPAAAGLELLVMDTRAHHQHSDGQYGARREDCGRLATLLGVASLRDVAPGDLDVAAAAVSAAVPDADTATRLLRRLRHVVTEIDRVRATVELLRAGRLREIGPLLEASHASLRADYQVSCAELDLACRAAVGAGALGARMTGGGFGGSAIALVESAAVDAVASAVTAAFAAAGFVPPAFLRAVPSAPACRIT